MRGSGEYTTRVSFVRAVTETDALNDPVEVWRTIGQAKARVSWGSGTERLQAAQVQAQQGATVTVRTSPVSRCLTMTDRLRLLEADWNIVAIAQPNRHEMQFSVERI